MKNNWEGIYGQDLVTTNLEQLVRNSSIPHAFLFYGPSGTGKEFAAIRFAQSLNLSILKNNNVPNLVEQIQKFSEPYIKYIVPLPRGKNETDSSGPFEKLSSEENEMYWEELSKKEINPYYKIQIPKANQIKISSIRDINKFLSFDYSDIPYRIVLISDAHLMNESAQNALLKNLEEPPEGIIFILCTAYPNQLRETIRSRCWMLPFQPLSEIDIKNVLVNYFGKEKEISRQVAPFSGGSVTTALELLEQDFEEIRDKTIFILRYSFGRKYHSALNEFAGILKENSDETLKLIIQMIIIWLTDVQRFKYSSGGYYFVKHIETLEKFNARFPDIELQKIIFKLDRLASSLKNNININLIVLNIIYELADLTMPAKK